MKNKEIAGFSSRFEKALELTPSSSSTNPNEKSFLDKSGRELGELFGVSKKTISNWRKLDVVPSIDKCALICKRLDISIEWLLLGVGNPEQWGIDNLSLREIWFIKIFRRLTNPHQNKIIARMYDLYPEDEDGTPDDVNKQRMFELVTKNRD